MDTPEVQRERSALTWKIQQEEKEKGHEASCPLPFHLKSHFLRGAIIGEGPLALRESYSQYPHDSRRMLPLLFLSNERGLASFDGTGNCCSAIIIELLALVNG